METGARPACQRSGGPCETEIPSLRIYDEGGWRCRGSETRPGEVLDAAVRSEGLPARRDAVVALAECDAITA